MVKLKFLAEIDIMPMDGLLDPQGKVVTEAMINIELPEISSVRIGKHISMIVETKDEESARAVIESACGKMLVNPIVEFYTYSLGIINY